jgi:hypothetical protein
MGVSNGLSIDATLLALEKAFSAAWSELRASDPLRDSDKDAELRVALADKLMALADAGVTDPEELRARTLANISILPTKRSFVGLSSSGQEGRPKTPGH